MPCTGTEINCLEYLDCIVDNLFYELGGKSYCVGNVVFCVLAADSHGERRNREVVSGCENISG